MPVIILFFMLSSSLAVTLEVHEPMRGYVIDYGATEVSLKAPNLNYTFKARDCNKLVMEQLADQPRLLKRYGAWIAGKKNGAINYTFNNQIYHELRESQRGKFLGLLPGEFLRLKREEQIHCKSKQRNDGIKKMKR